MERLIPTQVAAEFVRGQLSAETANLPFANSDGMELASGILLDELISCGLLQSSVIGAVSQVRFTDDPVAEFLAAMRVVFRGSSEAALLSERLKRAGSEVEGLREALKRVLEWLGPVSVEPHNGLKL